MCLAWLRLRLSDGFIRHPFPSGYSALDRFRVFPSLDHDVFSSSRISPHDLVPTRELAHKSPTNSLVGLIVKHCTACSSMHVVESITKNTCMKIIDEGRNQSVSHKCFTMRTTSHFFIRPAFTPHCHLKHGHLVDNQTWTSLTQWCEIKLGKSSQVMHKNSHSTDPGRLRGRKDHGGNHNRRIVGKVLAVCENRSVLPSLVPILQITFPPEYDVVSVSST